MQVVKVLEVIICINTTEIWENKNFFLAGILMNFHEFSFS